MHSSSPLVGIFLVLSAALIGAIFCLRLRQSTLLGYIAGGIIIGPFGLGLVPKEDVEAIADIGVFLLLFSVGLELSLQKLSRVKTIAVFGGSLFSLMTIALTATIGIYFNWSLLKWFTIGCVLAISNTSVVLRLLGERGEIGSKHGNITTGILIFQDVVAVPLLALIPIFATRGNFEFRFLGQLLGQVILYIILLYGLARFLVPLVLRAIARTKSKELFSIALLAICAAIAASAQGLGLSLALGAFIAGIIISESDFHNRASSEILPMKDAFGSIFFVSVGMLLDPRVMLQNWQWLPLAVLALVVGKFIVSFVTIFLFRQPIKTNVYTSLALGQVGEFSLLLLILALQNSIISEYEYQFLLATSVLSIFLTPYLLRLGRPLAQRLNFLERTSWLSRGLKRDQPSFMPQGGSAEENSDAKNGHVVLCGYGPTGSIVMKKLLNSGLKTVVIDLNYRIIQSLKAEHIDAIYGDCSSSHVLEASGIQKASLLVVTIPDPVAMRAIVTMVRQMRSDLPIYVRVKYNSDRERMLDLGATEVIWEEYEAGEELAKRSLTYLNLAGSH